METPSGVLLCSSGSTLHWCGGGLAQLLTTDPLTSLYSVLQRCEHCLWKWYSPLAEIFEAH